MATGAGKGRTRADKERTRLYQARQQFHESLGARRRRDNLIAGVVGGLLIVAVIGGQVAYYTAGPGAPTPEPTPSATPTATPTTTPTDATTPAPTDTATETPAP